MYMASVLIEHWSDAIDRQTQNASVTTAAFAPAVRLHLLDAYGWQMLACNRVAALPSRPPHHTSRMPVIAEGITVAPEVKELALLEQTIGMPDTEFSAFLKYKEMADKHDYYY